MFNLWDHRRKRGEPPQWFSPSATLHMSDVDWNTYLSHVHAHLVEVSNPWELVVFNQLRLRSLDGRIGGEHDG